jgi:hypothetical protein
MRIQTLRKTLSTSVLVIMSVAIFHSTARADNSTAVSYRTVTIDGLDIFYREAGNPERPTILLPHGFPTSSHMFRDLIPVLADQYHLVDTGHFALESHSQEIADLMRDFLNRKVDSCPLAAN